jgi:hypothetical protein
MLNLLLFSLLLTTGKAPQMEVRSTSQEVTLKFTIPELKQEQKLENTTRYVELSIPSAGVRYDIGKPRLPVIRKFVQVPEDAELSIQTVISGEHSVELPYPVYPKQAPIPKTPGFMPEFTIDEAFYATDEFLPEVRARIIRIGEIRGNRVAVIETYPVQYNPRTNMLKFADEIEVTIRYSGANWARTRTKLTRYGSRRFENRTGNTVVNHDYYSSLVDGLPLPIGYLIITPDAWYSSMLPLVDWKEQKGYHVTIAKLSETGTDTNDIFSYIANAYDNWQTPPSFVLLVGDVDQIGCWRGKGDGAPRTDLDYSLMSPGDYFPDIDLSRLSVADQAELDGIVDKTIRYEKNNWSQGTDWCKRGYFIASSDGGSHQIAEGTHQYCMDIARAKGTICDSLWLFYGEGTALDTAMNDGRAWIMYSGHGSPGSWCDCGFGTHDVHELMNTDKPSFVGTYACWSGNFPSNECFSESWIRCGREGGIAAFASSVTSYWDEDDILQKRMFDAAFDSGFTWVSGMLTGSKLGLYTYYGDNPTTRRYFEMYNMMGDGSIDVYWDKPRALTVNHPPVVLQGAFSLNVTVSDAASAVQGALVCLSKDSIFTGYTDPLGVATISGTNLSMCTLSVTVTGHNRAPFFGSCQVISEGAYVAFLKHVIDDDSAGTSLGNGDGVVDAGEVIEFPLWIRNYGCDPACQVTGKLSTTDSFVTITDSLITFGTIAPGDSSIGSSPTLFVVSPNIPDNHLVLFDLTCTDDFGSTWSSTLWVRATHQVVVTLLLPNGNEIWAGESTHTISWSIAGVGYDSYRLLCAIGSGDSRDTVVWSLSSPHDYPDNFDSTWVIEHVGADAITVHFSDFHTESGFDFVRLYDKNDKAIFSYHGDLGEFWGHEVPGDVVKIRLFTDESNVFRGFDIDRYVAFSAGSGYADTIASDVSSDSDAWTWTLPDTICSRCMVKVQVLDASDSVLSEDESDDYFSIGLIGRECGIKPAIYALSQSYPNPCMGHVFIGYQLPEVSEVSLKIYDTCGRLVRTLVSRKQKAGYYRVPWNRKDKADKQLPAGIYFYRLDTPEFESTKKLILVQ